MIFGSITQMAKNVIELEMKEVLASGKALTAVDCTMGNGNDTLFLSRLLGENGTVYAFDIQEMALENTRTLLEANSISNAKLHRTGHENIDSYVDKADLVMFNLGYLPKGDHGLITKPETTLVAIDKSLDVLNPGGLLSIIIYYGHDGGASEKEAVLSHVSALDPKKFEVIRIGKINRPNNPPIVTIIRKN